MIWTPSIGGGHEGVSAGKLAKEWRDETIEAANERTQTMHAESQSLPSSGFGGTSISAPGAIQESDTSEDELALDQPMSRSFGKRRRMG